MKTCQYIYQSDTGWKKQSGEDFAPDILLAFFSGRNFDSSLLTTWHKDNFPNAQLIGCSSAGEIIDTEVHSNSIIVTGMLFEKTRIEVKSLNFEKGHDSFDIGNNLARSLTQDGLKLCFVLSEGLDINGTRLVEGLKQALPDSTLLTGGLAGDGTRFQETKVCLNEQFSSRMAIAVGFYGDNIDIEYGSMGGWGSFGPSRLVTHSIDNILYTLDDQNALALYKKYLGPHAKNLPSSALRFPLKVKLPNGQKVVRTILSVNEEEGSITFAGDIPQGTYAELMYANYDRLIDGASDAACNAMKDNTDTPELAILISCIGRKLALGQRVEEEIDVIQDRFGQDTTLTGFYAYGEICPFDGQEKATLNNQTMTITTFREH